MSAPYCGKLIHSATMRKTAELDKKLQMKIVDMYKQDDGYTTLSKHLNVPGSTICSIIKKYTKTDCVENKLRTGRKQLFSERMKRKIVRGVSKNPHLTTKALSMM